MKWVRRFWSWMRSPTDEHHPADAILKRVGVILGIVASIGGLAWIVDVVRADEDRDARVRNATTTLPSETTTTLRSGTTTTLPSEATTTLPFETTTTLPSETTTTLDPELGPAVLGPGDRLLSGEFREAYGGKYVLEMTAGEGLQASTAGEPEPWFSTGVEATESGAAIMQITDGNLVVYTRNPPRGDPTAEQDAVYESGTGGHPGASLVLRELNRNGVLDIVDANGDLVLRLGAST